MAGALGSHVTNGNIPHAGDTRLLSRAAASIPQLYRLQELGKFLTGDPENFASDAREHLVQIRGNWGVDIEPFRLV